MPFSANGVKRMQRSLVRVGLIPALCVLCFCGRNPWLPKESLVARGNDFYSKGLYEEAAIQYKKALQKDPRYGEAHYRLGLTLQKLQNPEAAYASFEQALELMPGHEDSLAQLANILLSAYLADPRRTEALKSRIEGYTAQMLAKNPQSFAARRIQAFLAAGDGRFEEAVRAFRLAEQLRPGECDINTGLTQNLLAAKQTAEAEQWASAYLPKHPDCGPLYDVLYAHYLATQRSAAAEALLQTKVKANPGNALFAIQLAEHYWRTQQPAAMQAVLDHLVNASPRVPNAYMEAADFYARIRMTDQALRLYQQGAAAEPKKKPAYWKRIAGLYLALGKPENAAQTLDELLAGSPEDLDALASRAAIRLSTGRQDETARAIADLERAVKQAPEDTRIRFELARAYLQAQKATEAQQHLNEILKRNPRHSGALRELAAYHIQHQDAAQAQTFADRLLEINPSDPGARLVRTAALALQGRYGEVRGELTRLLAEYPNLREARLQMAMLQLAEKRYAEAEKAFRALYQPGSPDVRPLKGLIEVYFAQKRGADALRMMQKEAAAHADSPAFLALLAQTAERAEQPAVAIEAHQKLAHLNPKDPEPWMALSRLHQQSGQAEQAIAAARRALEIAPHSAIAWGLLAAAQDQARQPAEAMASYRRALAIQPGNPSYMNNLACLLLDAGGSPAEALQLARKASEKLPADPRIADTLGLAYLKSGQTDSALQIFRSLAQRDPRVATYRLHLAEALLAKNDSASARRELETALTLRPSPAEEGRIRALLSSR